MYHHVVFVPAHPPYFRQPSMTRLLILPGIFAVATISVWLMLYNAPGWSDATAEGGTTSWELPSQFENFTTLAVKFKAYKNEHYAYISMLFTCTYLYKQTFAIPGSFLLNIIAGAVFGMLPGFIACCILTTLGSTLCYLFSEMFGREYVLYYFGERLTYLQQKIDDNNQRLLPFLLFARMFPISPSWLLNIVAPFLNIPLPIFAASAFVGLAPYNFVCVQAGSILSELKSWDDVFSSTTMLNMFSMALIPLVYAFFVRPRADSKTSALLTAVAEGMPNNNQPKRLGRRYCGLTRIFSKLARPPPPPTDVVGLLKNVETV
uniref:Golgi apparatus membrane protein TVP38 n=1 Tax=Panagrellus redivivus TaxID=6233 RepID=A0A7E4W120_PANRE